MWSWVKSLVVLPVLAGCGYTLSHRLSPTFEPARRGIFVPVMTNHTDEVGAEKVFTNALIRELQSRGQMRVVSREKAEVELWGAVHSISYGPTAFTEPGFQGLQGYRRLPTEYGVTVGLSLTLLQRASGKPVWSRSFSSFQRVAAPVDRTYDYEAPSAIGPVTQSLIDASYQELARNIMRDVYDEMVEVME